MQAIRSRRSSIYDEASQRHVLRDAVVIFSEDTGKIVDVLNWALTENSVWEIEEGKDGEGFTLVYKGVQKLGTSQSFRRIPLTDAGDLLLLPGLVDIATSVCDPGPRSWGDFESVSRVAASGGVTTILDLPVFNLIPTTTLASFESKVEAASRRLYVDCGFAAGLTTEKTSEVAGK